MLRRQPNCPISWFRFHSEKFQEPDRQKPVCDKLVSNKVRSRLRHGETLVLDFDFHNFTDDKSAKDLLGTDHGGYRYVAVVQRTDGKIYSERLWTNFYCQVVKRETLARGIDVKQQPAYMRTTDKTVVFETKNYKVSQ